MDIAKSNTEKSASLLIASFVYVVWNRRKEGRRPTIEEIEKNGAPRWKEDNIKCIFLPLSFDSYHFFLVLELYFVFFLLYPRKMMVRIAEKNEPHGPKKLKVN